MEDISESRNAIWPRIYGGAKYVFENRHHDETTYVLLIKELCRLNGCEYSEPWHRVQILGWDEYTTHVMNGILHGQAIPPGHKIIGLERTDVTCGRHEEFYRVVTEGPEAPTEPEPPKPTGTDKPTGATLTHNEKMNGLELRFPSKPTNGTLASLKAHGWKWSNFSGCWYTKYSEEQELFARGIVEAVEDRTAEIATALGFDSVASMREHEEWLSKQRNLGEKIAERVNEAKQAGSSVTDMRGVLNG
jgi:hypothetical protein